MIFTSWQRFRYMVDMIIYYLFNRFNTCYTRLADKKVGQVENVDNV